MSKTFAILEYSFLFKPSEAWTSGSSFERDLADFFGAHGYQAEVVETVGGTGRRLFYISKVDAFTPEPVPPQKGIQAVLKEMRGEKKGKNAKRN